MTVSIDGKTIVLENQFLRCVYSRKVFSDGTWTWCMTELVDKRHDVDHARGDQIDGIWQSSNDGTGEITRADVVEKETCVGARIHYERAEVTVCIYENIPAVGIHYCRPILETVDIGTPGGNLTGTYAFYGAERWRRPYQLYPESYYNVPELGDHDDSSLALAYRGHLIGIVYHPSTGLGFGRVMPVSAINIVKLLMGRGFEWFHAYGTLQNAKTPFSGWVFLVENGADDIASRGFPLANRCATLPTIPGR